MKSRLFLVASVLLLGVAASAEAGMIEWHVVNATFSDGATLTGSFEFDATAPLVGQFGDFELHVSDGDLPAFTYTRATSTASVFSGKGDFFYAFTLPGGLHALRLKPDPILTNAGGTLPLLTGAASTEFDVGSGIRIRELVSGEVTTAVPEPTSLALLGVGALGLFALRFRRQRFCR